MNLQEKLSSFYKGIVLMYHSAVRAFVTINVMPCIVTLLLSKHMLPCFEFLWITLRERHKRERCTCLLLKSISGFV